MGLRVRCERRERRLLWRQTDKRTTLPPRCECECWISTTFSLRDCFSISTPFRRFRVDSLELYVKGDWGNLKVAADAEAGAALRIKGRGAPVKPGSSERGDHYFVVKKVVYLEGVAEDETDAAAAP